MPAEPKRKCLNAIDNARDEAKNALKIIFDTRSMEEYNEFLAKVYRPVDLMREDAQAREFAASQGLVDTALKQFNDAKKQMKEALENLKGWS